MNRRQLFLGAGAAAVASVVPVPANAAAAPAAITATKGNRIVWGDYGFTVYDAEGNMRVRLGAW